MERTLRTRDMGRFSDLPENVLFHILSFLPTKLAARTSLVSRRFRRLWETCPALELNTLDFQHLPSSDLADLANRTILNRNPPSPLHRLCLRLQQYTWLHADLLTSSYISSLLDKAASLGLRHLTVKLGYEILPTVLPLIFSLSSLESLSLDRLSTYPPQGPECIISSSITLTRLKSLSIHTEYLHTAALDHLLSQLNSLEDLNLSWPGGGCAGIVIESMTIKRLSLIISCNYLAILTPCLEFFQLESRLIQVIKWGMPLLKKAVIQLNLVFPHSVPSICGMLMAVSKVVELHLDITESMSQKETFHALLEPSVDPPIFVRMKHFHLEICFHEFNMEDLVTIIQHSPALESLKLVHKPPVRPGKDKKKKLWRSRLPKNAEGNYRHAYFENLHIAENREVLLRKLIKKESSERLKT